MVCGCASKVQWRQPNEAKPKWTANCFLSHDDGSPWASIEERYASALKLLKADDASGVDALFEVAMATCEPAAFSCDEARVVSLHKSALNLLVVHGQRLCRLDPHSGLRIYQQGSEVIVPIRHHGFVWKPEDFDLLTIVGDYTTNTMNCLYRRPGAGVPLVVTSCNGKNRPFLDEESNFAASLCLTPSEGSSQAMGLGNSAGAVATLDLYDPLRCECTTAAAVPKPIVKDLSAPFAYRLKDQRTTILENFIDPASMVGNSHLWLIEPYQEGKIPVVFVHGLLSDPFTWVAMINQLRSEPWYVENFQTLVYDYPTGRAFFNSAARLRQQLAEAQRLFAPHDSDPTFSEMVLVGHSMGGLIGRTLISSSGNELWAAAANKPVQDVYIPPVLQHTAMEAFFFKASPQISRAVLIATPHKGSGDARRLIGRIGSAFVHLPEDLTEAHQQLIACNPGVFSEEMTRRIPTSIDLLEPNSCLLQALSRLPIDNRIQVHSIAGDYRCSLRNGPTDTVVPLSSALAIEAQSQFVTRTKHEGANKKPLVIAEVRRILELHLRATHAKLSSSGAAQPGAPLAQELKWREWAGEEVQLPPAMP